MAPSYSWIQLTQAVQLLSERLDDASNTFWTFDECVVYLQQALRMFNVLTSTWKTDFVFNSASLWNSLATLSGSPRLRTQTDIDCYTQMQYMLLEPPTGGTWTGSSQFNLGNLSQALGTRRDEMIQVGNLNPVLVPGIALTPNTRRTALPDDSIDVARVRYLPATGSATTLYRDDMVAMEYYSSPVYQHPSGTPEIYSLSSEPPLSWDVDPAPAQPGVYEAVILQSATALAPPAATLLNIPDDFTWVLLWGALADLLGRESEATDRPRAEYCAKRYMDGLALLQKVPWIMLGTVNGRAVTCDSIFATDRYLPNWDSTPASFGPVIVIGGMDFMAAPLGSGIGVTVLGNAPVPVVPGDFVQVSRSDFDIVLDLAQAFACFKMGGGEWQQALELEARAVRACAAENSRLKSMGAFSDILLQRAQAQDRDQERYATAGKKSAN